MFTVLQLRPALVQWLLGLCYEIQFSQVTWCNRSDGQYELNSFYISFFWYSIVWILTVFWECDVIWKCGTTTDLTSRITKWTAVDCPSRVVCRSVCWLLVSNEMLNSSCSRVLLVSRTLFTGASRFCSQLLFRFERSLLILCLASCPKTFLVIYVPQCWPSSCCWLITVFNNELWVVCVKRWLGNSLVEELIK